MVTPSSGNVFTDLGFGPGEAAVLGLRGKWDKFSLDMFVKLMAHAGRKVALAMA